MNLMPRKPALRPLVAPLPEHVERTRLRLSDGRSTTVYVARYDLASTAVRVVRLPHHDLPAAPRGDLLQAGPLLVRGGVPVVEDGYDPEGFSAGARQFDSDITAGRYPRAALGVARGRLLAVACDGRADGDAGLTMRELAEALAALGAEAALNLDGGGSTSLVCGGALRNVPREEHGVVLAGGRPVTTALTFTPR